VTRTTVSRWVRDRQTECRDQAHAP
jgi:hypothetical protein